MRIEIPGLTFAYLLDEIKGVNGALVKKVQELENGAIRIRVYGNGAQNDIIVSDNAFFISEYKIHAKQNASGFAALLNKHLKGARLEEIKQKGFERLFRLKFSNSKQLVFELFREGNIILLDENEKIIGAKHYASYSARDIKRGVTYVEPPEMKSFANVSLSEFKNMLDKQSVVRFLVKKLNIASVFAEEACFRAGIDKNKKALGLSPDEQKKLFEILSEFYSKKIPEKPELVEHSNKLFLVPFHLEAFACIKTFESINSALNELSMEKMMEVKQSEKIRELEKLKKSIEKQKEALAKKLQEAEFWKRAAQRIYENYVDVQQAFEFAKKEFEKKREEKIMYNKLFGSVILKEIDFKGKKAKIEFKD